MNTINITVVSNTPPGGRCRLYAQYAQALATTLGFNAYTVYPDDNHQNSAPGILLNNIPIMPNDGVIINTDDIFQAIILQTQLELTDLAGVRNQLETLIEDLISRI